MRKLFLSQVMAATLSACAHAPAQPPQSQVQTWEEFTRDHPDTFIQSYQASLAAETARLRVAGLGKDLDFIRSQVDALLPPGNYTIQATGANAAVLRRLRVDETANRLLRAGYRIRHLATPQQARSLVSAAADLFGDADALVLFAPIVVVADFDRVDKKPDGSADLVYRVSEPIKSSPPRGDEIRLFLNGPTPEISRKAGDPPPPPPPPNPAMWELSGSKRAVFFLQPPETIVSPPGRRAERPATLFSPMPVDGNRVLPGYHSGTQETTLAAIRDAARAQLCSPGYVAVATGTDLPHQC